MLSTHTGTKLLTLLAGLDPGVFMIEGGVAEGVGVVPSHAADYTLVLRNGRDKTKRYLVPSQVATLQKEKLQHKKRTREHEDQTYYALRYLS